MATQPQGMKSPLGTKVRHAWDQKYITLVGETEKAMGRAICGYPTKKGTPCTRRPKKQYGGYCSTHRHGLTVPSNTPTGITDRQDPLAEIKQIPPLMATMLRREQIILHFQECPLCTSRATCPMFKPQGRCEIEESFFYNFVKEAVQEHHLDTIDIPQLWSAAMAFIRSMRVNRVMAYMDPEEAERCQISWQVVRESKEFRDSMKELALSRRERQNTLRHQIGLSTERSGSLAEIMSSLHQQLPDGGEAQVAIRVSKPEQREEGEGLTTLPSPREQTFSYGDNEEDEDEEGEQ